MTTKTVYNSANGSETLAHQDQFTVGLFHMPTGTTEVKPPSYNAETQTRQFIDNAWVVADIPVPEEVEVPDLTYDQKREIEYPSLASQLDEIYHNGIDSWKSVIKVTKDKYPKPE